MSESEIVERVRNGLNDEGKKWNLEFAVDERVLREGAWLQVFVKSNSNRSNRAAESQIISDVESELSETTGEELLIAPVQEFVGVTA
jgi:hypothetical protein